MSEENQNNEELTDEERFQEVLKFLNDSVDISTTAINDFKKYFPDVSPTINSGGVLLDRVGGLLNVATVGAAYHMAPEGHKEEQAMFQVLSNGAVALGALGGGAWSCCWYWGQYCY